MAHFFVLQEDCQRQPGAQTNLLLNPGLEAPFTNSTLPNVKGVLASNWTAFAVKGSKLACTNAGE
jgi:hypothetical protein